MIPFVFLGTSGGLAIFFVGMIMMSRSITSLSSNKLKSLIAIFTTNPLLGILVGILVTTCIQSSSGTTVLVVSLVNGNVMNLYQATGVILGANIGTTITGHLMTSDFFTKTPHIFTLGMVLSMIHKNRKLKAMGKSLMGFSLLFIGMKIMVYSLNPLKNLMVFDQWMVSLEHSPIKGIAAGAAVTAIIQSSSAGIALIQGLAFQGLINITQALPLIMGQNIGTCVTTIIASIPADKNGKRVALIHLLFNVFGMIILFPFIGFFSNFICTITPENTVRQIANGHSLFNILSAILVFPFIKVMVYISKKIIR